MEEATSDKTIRARMVTRRTNELSNGIDNELDNVEVEEKIRNLKYAMEDLGRAFDVYSGLLTDDTALEDATKWYTEYDTRSNSVIKRARLYMNESKDVVETPCPGYVKFRKLEIPKFDSIPKNFFKWKEIFERFTDKLDTETKYDYLLTSTIGEANVIVSNRQSYDEAMDKLEEKFGNVHMILKILIDEIRVAPVVRKGNFKAFEQFSFMVNDFKDKLRLMGRSREAENSYVLQELESKLNSDDLHRWLESKGRDVDDRRVEDLAAWLEHQTNLRRITNNSNPRYMNSSFNNPEYVRKASNVNALTSEDASSPVRCTCCGSDHLLPNCPQFLQMNLNERWNCVKGARKCFRCLREGHRREFCQAEKCDICHRDHHTLLHKRTQIEEENLNGSTHVIYNQVANTDVTEISCLKPQRSLLPVVNVRLKNNTKVITVNAMLDSGSELNVITQDCCTRLNLSGDYVTMNIVGVGGTLSRIRTKKVNLHIIDSQGVLSYIECVVFNKACGTLPQILEPVAYDQKNTESLKVVSKDIDILIGMSSPELHQQYAFVPMKKGLYRIETRFGPCIIGPISGLPDNNFSCSTFNCNKATIMDETCTEKKLWNHLQAEVAGINDVYFSRKSDDADKQFDEKMKSAWKQDPDGRFIVNLPWKTDPSVLSNNREQVIYRDKILRRQLKEKLGVFELFQDQINEMIKEGIIRKVEADYPKRYLPLLAIVDLQRESSKVRICLDAKCRYKGKGLNDVLLKGSCDIIDILQAITRFRSGLYVLVGDIRKMYWQIKISERDQQFHGIIWNNSTYVFTRVGFGDKPSPSIANHSMKMIAYAGGGKYPNAADMLTNKRYVDDLMDASSSIDHLVAKREETTELLGNFGFNVKAWYSNHSVVGIVETERKILGLRWNVKRDEIEANCGQTKFSRENGLTKRMMLSRLAEVWDPLGLCAGVMMTGKLLFQAVVREKLDWDTKIKNDETVRGWRNWLLELEKCNDVLVSRSIVPRQGVSEYTDCSVIGFCDGSSVAHGGVVYLRYSDNEEKNVAVKFLAAKGKLNSIKGITVPRSELCGSLLLSRLTYSVEEALVKTEIQPNVSGKVLFTDSTTVLSWIRAEAIMYKPFVKNKILEINELHSIDSWRYITSKDNKAADLLSKGCQRNGLDDIINGPEILYRSRKDWPTEPELKCKDNNDVIMERNVSYTVSVMNIPETLFEPDRFSNWKKVIRVTSHIFKVINLMRKKSMSIFELRELSLVYWIKEAQRYLPDLESKELRKLSPYYDDMKMIRINGRLNKSPVFDFERKHPLLLPNRHQISKLIIQQAHSDVYHAGYMRVVSEVRKKFWIIGAMSMAKQIGQKCVVCRRWRGRALDQMMSDLPKFRVTPGFPFENTAVDYFGPVEIKQGRMKRLKGYGAVFTCLTTRAIHIELVTDLTTDKFLQGMRRFISLYGQPRYLRSDNGRNFVGAANEIRNMLKAWKESKDSSGLKEFCEQKSISWVFSTPLASHHNGAVEAMIKSIKMSLNKIVKNRAFTEEEYRTIFAEITAVINSRPLWPSSDGDVDQPPITCMDLLRPRGLERDPQTMNLTCQPKKRYQYIQSIVDEWWKFWLRYFTPNLQTRGKWHKEKKNLDKGDIVLLIDPSTPRGTWKMGKVSEVFPDEKNYVRSAKVYTSTGEYCRPITKLTLLLSKEELNENE